MQCHNNKRSLKIFLKPPCNQQQKMKPQSEEVESQQICLGKKTKFLSHTQFGGGVGVQNVFSWP